MTWMKIASLAVLTLGSMVVSAGCDCEHRVALSLEPALVQRDTWTTVTATLAEPLPSTQIEDVGVYIKPIPTGTTLTFSRGESSDPDQLRNVVILDRTTVKLDLRVTANQPGDHVMVSVVEGEPQNCGRTFSECRLDAR